MKDLIRKMEIKGLDKIYIIHYPKLTERRDYLEGRLKELGIEKYGKWVISTDDGFNKKESSLYDESEKALKEREEVLGSKLPRVGKLDIIMVLHHLRILKEISKKKDGKVSMVVEDDVLLSNDFPERLGEAIRRLNEVEWEICYADKGALFIDPPVKKNNEDKVYLYVPLDKRSNTTGAYLITPRGSQKILKLMRRFSISIDNELSYIQKKYNLKVYWTVPFLTRQGSIEYVYASNVRTGSLTGVFMKNIRRVEKIDPKLANKLLILSNNLRDKAAESKSLTALKKKIKSLAGLRINA